MSGIRVLAFKLNDAPRMLSSAEEIEEAIGRGQITAETEVTLYLDDGSKRYAAARQHAQLADYFSAPEPPVDAVSTPAAPVAPPAPPPAAVEVAASDATPPVDHDAARDDNEDESDESDEPVSPPHEEDYRSTYRQPEAATDSGGVKKYVGFGVAALVAILLLRQCTGDVPTDGGDTAAQGSEAVAAADAALPAEDAAATPAEALDTSSAGEFRLLRDSPLLASPNGAAGPSLRTGAKVFVAGTVDGFAKVSDEDGRSGYMSWSDINGNPYLTERYRLNFNNRCNVPKTFLLIWHQNGAWYTSGNQTPTIGAGEFTTLNNTVDGVRSEIVLDRLELYYRPLPRGLGGYSEIRPTSERTVVIDGNEEKMFPAIPEITDSGNVTVTFDGSAC